MADRFYINTSNLVTFTAGERPAADKFNAVNKYFSRGFTSIAKVIGDAYDTGAPHNLASNDKYRYLTNLWNRTSDDNSRPLDILNISRLIGPASNLNPKILNRPGTIEETIPAGVSSFHTKFVPSAEITITGLTRIEFANVLAASTEYKESGGKIYFAVETSQSYTINYAITPEALKGGPNYIDAEFNVIPDPNQTGTLTIIENIEGDYEITLPTITHQQSGLNDFNDSSLSTIDPNSAQHLKLPVWMGAFGVDTALPSGVVALKNRTTGEVYTDATYTLLNINRESIKVSGVELCLNDGHVFCLITVGTDITTSIDDLRDKSISHTHDGTFGEQRISIYDLKDIYKYAPPSGVYGASSQSWNPLSPYLHRDGFWVDGNSNNGNNAMRGPLLMGLTSFHPLSNTVISDGTGTSEPVEFGGQGTKIFREDKTLKIKNTGTSEGFDIDITAKGSLIAKAEQDNVSVEALLGSVSISATSGVVSISASTIAFNNSCNIKDDTFDDVVTDYTLGLGNSIGRSKYDSFNKQFLIEKESHTSLESVGDPTPVVAGNITDGIWTISNPNLNNILGDHKLIENDEDFYYQENLTKDLAFTNATYTLNDHVWGNMISIANTSPNFYINLPFHSADGNNDYTGYLKHSEYKIGNSPSLAKREVALVDSYIHIYRGHWFDSYDNQNYYTKNTGYIRSRYNQDSEISSQGSVNIQYLAKSSGDPELKKASPATGNNITYTLNDINIGQNALDQPFNWEFANNQLSYILDYRKSPTDEIHKNPVSSNWNNATYPTSIIINASVNTPEDLLFSYCYSGTTHVFPSKKSLGTIPSSNFIKNSPSNLNYPYFEGKVNLTSIFIDLILRDTDIFPPNESTATPISKHYDFDIKVAEEKIGELLLLDVQFLNVTWV